MKISLRQTWLLLAALFAAPYASSPAHATCTSSTDNLTLNCSGTLSSAITLYDPAAAYQPTGGSNSYTPASYSQNPPTLTVVLDNTVNFSVTTNATSGLADKGLIVANYSNTENPAVNNVVLNNAGSLSLTTSQIATSRMEVIVADSQVNSFTVNNSGTIAVTQNFFSSFNASNLSVTSSGSPATYSAKYSGATLNDMAALYSDDNTNEFTLNNSATGQVLATGNYATVYYGRADTTINNSGTIANTSWTTSDTIATGHWAIAAWAGTDYNTAPNTNPDSNIVFLNTDGSVTVEDTSALTITNNVGATIKGDIIAMDITPLVYAASVASSTNPFPDPSSLTVLPLAISSTSAGPRDSNIENYGTINGNFYLGSGTHVIDNAAGATITGNLDVDQRPVDVVFSTPQAYNGGAGGVAGTSGGTFLSAGGTDNSGNACPASGQSTTDAGCAQTMKVEATVVGGQSLTMTNEGTWSGDINIFDQASSVNAITLTGTGFTGNVVAINGTGSNTLTLNGVTNLASVYQFSTLNLGTSQVTVTPNATTNTAQEGVTLVSGATLTTTIGANGQYGSLNFVGGNAGNALNLQGPTTIVPIFTGIAHTGQTVDYLIANAVSGDTADITVQSTALVSFTDPSPGITITGTVMSPYQVPGISNAGAATLTNLLSYGGSNATLQTLGAAVENLTTLDQVRNAAEQLRPNVNGASIQVPLDISETFQAQIGSRLDSLLFGDLIRDGGWYADAEKPVAVKDEGVWVNGIGFTGEQHTTAAISGYDAKTCGLIAGYDHLFNNVLRLGGAAGYAMSSINDATFTGNHQSQETVEGLAYASYIQPKWYVDASGGAARLGYNTQRTVSFSGFNDVATAAYNGLLYTAQLDGGYPIRTPYGYVVPVAGVTYAHVKQDAYSETSANGAALAIAAQNTDSLRSSLGLKAVFPLIASPGFAVSLEPHALWNHEFDNTAQIVSAGFVGGSGSFIATGPTPDREMADVGAALRLGLPNDGESLAVSYNSLLRNSYIEQVAMLRARVDF